MIRYKSTFLFSWFSYLLVVVIVLHSCSSDKNKSSETQKHASIGQAEIKYAKGFSITYYENFKVLRINSGGNKVKDTAVYVLLAKDKTVPQGYETAQIIRTPLNSLVGLSSSHIALADFADAVPAITGLGSLQYVSNPQVLKRISEGKIKETGDETTLNTELVINMKPGLVMVTGNPDDRFSRYSTLTSAGVPVMLNSDWLETTPLGKAEWVKVMGALMDREQAVNAKFNALEKKYNILAELGRNAVQKPKIITGLPYKDTWYVPAGESFMARFFEDAGTTYSWSSSKGTGSLALSFEMVAPVALQADFWLSPGALSSKDEIKAVDSRYQQFKSFRQNKIYNNNKRSTVSGTNDYWESGTVNPQLVLADMIAIFHPELLPQHELYYFKPVK
ncbi:ABC transporter substrate-binding protein [Pedobacter antarcticus]|uniref:ABC transporter substrate-binding protein n=1 Tax=Pedobacter antarcticus TaxID=34086 RepID=UPI00088FA469|nr:ABC transporter substrate-binding protein [Pedobacter antarcticus]SDL78631.1 iron complex transport system substrate-binding protein [Pedobacter antarcticus]